MQTRIAIHDTFGKRLLIQTPAFLYCIGGKNNMNPQHQPQPRKDLPAWHLVLWARRASDLSKFMAWVRTTHVRRWREHRGSGGEGHLYQGRIKSFLVQNDQHFLTLLRYVVANPLRAGLVRRAEARPWSSLGGAAGSDQTRVRIAPWPVGRPPRWAERVNELLDPKTLDHLHTSVVRNRPSGDDQWTARVAKNQRDPGRPRKTQKKEQSK